MRRWHVIMLSMSMMAFLALIAGWNRTAADDQSVDFRMSQIMVKLTQIEWQLTQVRNRLGGQDNRLEQIDRQLERILEEIGEEAAKTVAAAEAAEAAVTASRPAAPDPVLVGTWRMLRNDLTDDVTTERIRRYLSETKTDPALLDSKVMEVVNRMKQALDLPGLRSIRFNTDARYVNESGGDGIWSVYGDRLIRIGKDGSVSQAAYLVSGSDLSLLFTRDQMLSALKTASQTWSSEDQAWFDAAFDQKDGLRVSLVRDN